MQVVSGRPSSIFGGANGILTSTAPVTRARRLETGSVELTLTQHKLLVCMQKFVRAHGMAATRRELGR